MKGQISIFVIISIVVIFGVIIISFFLVKDNSVVREYINRNSVSSEIMPVYEKMDSCSNQIVIDAIRIVGLQGGYVKLPNNYLATNLGNIAYGYYNGKNTLPSKVIMEKEISSYIEGVSPLCLYDDVLINYKIVNEKPIVETKINKDNVEVSVSMNIFVTKNNVTYKLDKTYNSKILIRLGDMIDVANEIVEREKKDPGYIPLTYLSELDYNILTMPNDDNDVVYAIVDRSNKSLVDGVAYSFLFANKLGA